MDKDFRNGDIVPEVQKLRSINKRYDIFESVICECANKLAINNKLEQLILKNTIPDIYHDLDEEDDSCLYFSLYLGDTDYKLLTHIIENTSFIDECKSHDIDFDVTSLNDAVLCRNGFVCRFICENSKFINQVNQMLICLNVLCEYGLSLT